MLILLIILSLWYFFFLLATVPPNQLICLSCIWLLILLSPMQIIFSSYIMVFSRVLCDNFQSPAATSATYPGSGNSTTSASVTQTGAQKSFVTLPLIPYTPSVSHPSSSFLLLHPLKLVSLHSHCHLLVKALLMWPLDNFIDLLTDLLPAGVLAAPLHPMYPSFR